MDNLAFDYQQIQEIGILVGVFTSVAVSLFAIVRRIYCKGKNDTILNDRITLLENWKQDHIKEYQKLQETNEEAKKELFEVGKKISYLIGLYEATEPKNHR